MAGKHTPLIVSIIAALGVTCLFVFGEKRRDRSLESFRLTIGEIGRAGPDATPAQWKRLEKLRAEQPADGDWEVQFALARYHRLKGESVKALDRISRAASGLPATDENFDVRSARWEIPTFRAKILRGLGRHEESLKQLETAWAINQTSRHIALGLAESHFHFSAGDDNAAKDHLLEAEKFARQAMQLSARDKGESETSDYADAWNMRGLIRMRHEDHLGARSDFRQALKLQPEHGQALYNLALAAATLSVEYAKPKDGSAETYRAEATRTAQELQALYPKLHEKLMTKTGFNRFLEGMPLH